MKRVAIYLGSTGGVAPYYAHAAAAFGAACAHRNLDIVYGGGGIGLMGVLADAALAAGGKVYGVIPRAMIAQERAHHGLTELLAVDSMHQRKEAMASMADAFVALPGGMGTLDELFEVLTWRQLGLHAKPIGVFNVLGFYDPLLHMLDCVVSQGFVSAAHRHSLIADSDPMGLLQRLNNA